MKLSIKAFLAASLAFSFISVATATTIVIDDRTETPALYLNGSPISFAENFTLSAFVGGSFTGVNVRFIVLDPGTTNVSDLITLHVGVGKDAVTSVSLSFVSDSESPLTYIPSPIDEIITETGDFQTIYSSPDLSTLGLPDLVISFASDVEGTAPEPATLALLGMGLAGFGFSRRRKRN